MRTFEEFVLQFKGVLFYYDRKRALEQLLRNPLFFGAWNDPAKVTKGADDHYVTEIVVSPKATLGGEAKDLDVNISIDHAPTAGSNNETYAGIVRISHPARGRRGWDGAVR